jgi:hypothetical protein
VEWLITGSFTRFTRNALLKVDMKPPVKYTCAEYRQEMILLGLRRRLEDPNLPDAEKERIIQQLKSLEDEMGMD